MTVRHILLLLMLCIPAFTARADVVVVVHPDSPLKQLSQQQINDIYLGRTRAFAESERLLILDQPRNSELRGRFFALLNGMDLRRVNAYWARLQFSGDTQPPIQLPSSQEVLETVAKNRLAIGYVDSSIGLRAVRPLLVLKE